MKTIFVTHRQNLLYTFNLLKMEIKDIQIRLLKADNPNIDTSLFYDDNADKIIEHFCIYYTDLTFTLIEKNSFWLYIYPYLELFKKYSFEEVITNIAQDFQTFEINAYTMN